MPSSHRPSFDNVHKGHVQKCTLSTTIMRFGSTKLIVGASKAKFCGESFGEVRFVIAPQKSGQKCKKICVRDQTKLRTTVNGVEK